MSNGYEKVKDLMLDMKMMGVNLDDIVNVVGTKKW